jgi:hypothetical protein
MIKSERPLDLTKKWLVHFVESVFHPGIYIWIWQTTDGAWNQLMDELGFDKTKGRKK